MAWTTGDIRGKKDVPRNKHLNVLKSMVDALISYVDLMGKSRQILQGDPDAPDLDLALLQPAGRPNGEASQSAEGYLSAGRASVRQLVQGL